jgi:hypothetical protein
VLGEFVVFLRDNIKRLIISGMILPGVVLASGVGGFDAARNTHTPTQL